MSIVAAAAIGSHRPRTRFFLRRSRLPDTFSTPAVFVKPKAIVPDQCHCKNPDARMSAVSPMAERSADIPGGGPQVVGCLAVPL